MTALRHLYTTAVLWLLSVVAKDAVEAIYSHGHEDGANELRDFMRRELTAVQAATATDRMRSYNRGFTEAMRLFDDELAAEAPIERVM
jgi:hypothetical protein